MKKVIISLGISLLSIIILSGFKVDNLLPKAKNLTISTRCDACGMVILNYPGPHAEIVIKKPNGKLKYKYYGNIVESMGSIIKELRKKGNIVTVYVQPMDNHKFSNMYLKGNWMLAKNAFFVVNSKKYFIMGPGYYPFKNKKNAINFMEKYHGRIMSFDRIVAILSKRITA